MRRLAAEASMFGVREPMDDLTLDVCILISGSGIGDEVYGQDCKDLMKKMISIENYYLALDERGKIKLQYMQKLKWGTLGHHFVQRMADMEKTVIVPWQDLRRSIRVKLEEQGFTRDNEDYKFVVVASGTCCRKLVSHEPHFFNLERILKRIPVIVLWPSEVLL